MFKSVFLGSIKLALAIGLIIWLINSGKLDLNLAKSLFSNPLNVIFIILLMLFTSGIAAFRWKLILEHNQNLKLSFVKIFNANWIGIFFNSVIPGAVSGDLIKIFYVKDQNENWSKAFLFGSIFLDRLIGMFGLILIGCISCLANYEYLTNISESVKTLVHTNFLLGSFVIISFIMIFFLHELPLKVSGLFKKVRFLNGITDKCENIWKNLYSFRSRLILYLILSILVQGIAVCIFWYVTSPFASSAFELKHAFTIFPIGMIALAIPIAPAGLGVGHFIFENLFSYLGISGGANLFNIYFIMLIITYLTGIIPYVLHRGKKVKMKDLTE